jgi:predicted aspartyl protease
MTTQAERTGQKARERKVGKVTTTVTVENSIDAALAARGNLGREDVRSVTLNEVLVDTGATTLCLPIDIVERIGLEMLRSVEALTATGPADVPLYEHARLTVMGRTGTFECIALPVGTEPLLGVIPLEMLGLEPDLQNQRLRVLPDHGRRTYMLAPSPILH